MKTRCDIAGFVVRRTSAKAVIRFLNGRIRKRRRAIVFYANSNFVTRLRAQRQALGASPEVLILNDGIAMDVASFLCHGAPFPENLNGTDFTVRFLADLERESGVFLLGSRPEIVGQAAAELGRLPKVRIVGCQDGYSLWDDEAAVIDRINRSGADVLLVALGNPLQENWILRNRQALDATVIVAVGALFSFVSGYKPRAPRILRALHLEWAHRLALEPNRLVGRYTVGMLRFFATVITYSFRGRAL